MSSHLLKSLVAVAVASTLAACGHQSRDTDADTAMVTPPPVEQAAIDPSASGATAPVSSDMSASTSSQVGSSTAAQTATSPTPVDATASATPVDATSPAPIASTMDTQDTASGPLATAANVNYDPSGAMKTEIVESSSSAMGASGAGTTASSMDQSMMCDMYSRLKAATSTEERETIMSRMLLDLPKDSGLASVRDSCAG